MQENEDGPITEEVKKAAEDLKDGAKKAAKAAGEELDKIDIGEEALNGIKEIESLLDSLTSKVKSKRKEWEKEGAEKTFKKDAETAKETVKDTTNELLDDVEKAVKNIKKMLEDD